MAETITLRRRRRSAPGVTPTLRDVARAGGVSTASASRALARPELVSEALRRAIVGVARDLGYIPNAAARTLSGRVSKLVGAVVDTLDDPVAARAIEALMRRLEAEGWTLLLATAGNGPGEAARRMRELVLRGCDALALFGVAAPADPAALPSARRVPCACLDRARPGEMALGAGFDRGRALALGARYLRELQHRRIGLFALRQTWLAGDVREALGDVDLDLFDTAATTGTQEGRGVREALDRLLAQPDPPTALICGSDAAAGAVLRECAQRGLPVPGSLSLIGFGDTDLARQTKPGLTTLRVPAQQAGIAAAEFLLAAVAGEPRPAIEGAAKLVVRDSTGPAPQ
jgi:LacI family transcriptional regulator